MFKKLFLIPLLLCSLVSSSQAANSAFTNAAVFGTSPTITTPNIVGVTDASSAAAGSVGEVISSVILVGSAVSLTSTVTANVTSISLTAGDWDVTGEVWLNPAGTTVTAYALAGITTTSATMPTVPATNTSTSQVFVPATASDNPVIPVSPARINVSGTTTVYLVGSASFSVSTNGAYGKIIARRRR